VIDVREAASTQSRADVPAKCGRAVRHGELKVVANSKVSVPLVRMAESCSKTARTQDERNEQHVSSK
jgi:hypothetical protein